MFRLKSPSHPGPFIKSGIIAPLALTVTGAAKALGVTRPVLSAVLNGRAALSPEMALRMEKAFGSKMGTLLRRRRPKRSTAAGCLPTRPGQPI